MSADQSARLRPIGSDEYPDWVAGSKAGYIAGIVEHAGMPLDAARVKADEDFARILPRGLKTPGHALFVVETATETVGRLWLAERETYGLRALYIYDIDIDERHRGQGFGRQAMLLAEDEARRRGIGRIELNVFGGNDVARGLYRSLGYRETAVQMAKDLDPRP